MGDVASARPMTSIEAETFPIDRIKALGVIKAWSAQIKERRRRGFPGHTNNPPLSSPDQAHENRSSPQADRPRPVRRIE
jgi:hypothetical protein